jgi:methylase of polypeptide subunit release factors
MTTLMKTLIERLREIPEEEQDKYAAAYLKELDEDQRWEELFDQTTEEQWAALVDDVRRDGEEEEPVPLDQFLDAQES